MVKFISLTYVIMAGITDDALHVLRFSPYAFTGEIDPDLFLGTIITEMFPQLSVLFVFLALVYLVSFPEKQLRSLLLYASKNA